MIIDAKENILLFHKEIVQDPNHRYRSWEHCYSYFQDNRPFHDENNFDIATLHLAFYLASWGMYRGSSQLLQKDYRVHASIVREIIDHKYDCLWNLDFDNINESSTEIALIFDLIKRLRQLYNKQNISPTDTLITKILLGAMGCIPAYDRFFIDGIREWGNLPAEYEPKFPAYFGTNSYIGLVKFYKHHKVSIIEAKKEIESQGLEYPIMKLIDMYFWNLGYQSY